MTKPLFLYFAPSTIHSPTMVPEGFWKAKSDALSAIGNYARKLVAAEVKRRLMTRMTRMTRCAKMSHAALNR